MLVSGSMLWPATTGAEQRKPPQPAATAVEEGHGVLNTEGGLTGLSGSGSTVPGRSVAPRQPARPCLAPASTRGQPTEPSVPGRTRATAGLPVPSPRAPIVRDALSSVRRVSKTHPPWFALLCADCPRRVLCRSPSVAPSLSAARGPTLRREARPHPAEYKHSTPSPPNFTKPTSTRNLDSTPRLNDSTPAPRIGTAQPSVTMADRNDSHRQARRQPAANPPSAVSPAPSSGGRAQGEPAANFRAAPI